MARDTGKAVVLRHLGQVVLAVVPADGLDVPVHQYLVEMSGDGGRVHQFIIGGAHS